MEMKCQFIKMSQKIAEAVGHPYCFVTAFLYVVLWGLSGPLFGFSDTWQLVINTSTTIITFLMVFLIQSTQNRDTEALHLKLDELLRAQKGAHLALLDIEELEDDDFQSFRKLYASIGQEARDKLEHGEEDIYETKVELQSMMSASQRGAAKKQPRKRKSKR